MCPPGAHWQLSQASIDEADNFFYPATTRRLLMRACATSGILFHAVFVTASSTGNPLSTFEVKTPVAGDQLHFFVTVDPDDGD